MWPHDQSRTGGCRAQRAPGAPALEDRTASAVRQRAHGRGGAGPARRDPLGFGGGVIAIVILLAWVLVPILRWRTTTYELTTRRLRLREGIVSRQGRDFPLLRISDVSFSHGPIDRLLGCGKLIVESAGEHGQLVLTEIPDVQQVQATLFQLVENEQQRLAGER